MHHNSEFYKSINLGMEKLLNHSVPELLLRDNKKLIKILEDQVDKKHVDQNYSWDDIGKTIGLNYILKKTINFIIESFNKDYKYDHKIGYNDTFKTYIIKTDLETKTTGNINIELRCNGENSGLYISESDFYVYICPKMEYNILIFDRTKLLQYVQESEKTNKHNVVQINQDKEVQIDCILINYNDIINLWKLGDIILKKDKI